ncbi:MAG TPA: (d)CMP kinase [Verrucomicrobiae bacterium]|nr:(d)CMP kinase [Verrucomicrobiae bacterium]
MSVPVITIDGPSGVGKGTVARAVARQLNWHFLDSGSLYRILALAAQKAGVASDDASALADLAPKLNIKFDLQRLDLETIVVDGHEISARIREETTGQLASRVAIHPPVRAALLERQRAFRRAPGLVADGRDMGTVVFPDAGLKIFLDASADERARRRMIQLRKAGIEPNMRALREEIRERDVRDRNRAVSPLKPADDAVTIDTTELSIDAVLERVAKLIEARDYAT